jgi:general transcription factor 3C protein 4
VCYPVLKPVSHSSNSLTPAFSYYSLASWKSPLHTLRAFFFHLRDPKRLEALHSKFLEVLQVQPEVGALERGVIDVPSGVISSVDEARMDVDDEKMKMKENFRFSISTHLFGWDELLRLRMKLSLADFAWVRCASSFSSCETTLHLDSDPLIVI